MCQLVLGRGLLWSKAILCDRIEVCRFDVVQALPARGLVASTRVAHRLELASANCYYGYSYWN